MPLRLLIFAAVSGGAAFGLGLVYLIRRAGLDWSGLIVDDATGKVSGTKVCALTAFAAVTAVFLHAGWPATPGDGLVLLIGVYYGLATGSQFASKLVGARFGGGIAAAGTITTERSKIEETKTTVAAPAAASPASINESAVNPQKRSDP